MSSKFFFNAFQIDIQMRRHDYCFTIFAALLLLGGVYQFIRAALPPPPDVPCDCSKCGGGVQGGRRLADARGRGVRSSILLVVAAQNAERPERR